MNIEISDEFLLVKGRHSFFLVAKSGARFGIWIEAQEKEYSQTIEPDDIVVASAPEGGEVEPAAMLIEMVRKYRLPLMVLPKDHPGSKRFRYVVSVGPAITTSCSIRRGTHPEQHLVCSSDELAGLALRGVPGGVDIDNLPEWATLQRLQYRFIPDTTANRH